MSRFVFVFICLLISGMSASAQQGRLDKANRLFEKLAFNSAAKVYADLAKSHEDVFIYGRLADCYRLTEQFAAAETWYAKAVRLNGAEAAHFLHYGEALMANEKYAEAGNWLNVYLEKKPGDELATNLLTACQDIASLDVVDYPCELFNLSINTSRSEFGPAYFEDKLLFCSDQDTVMGVQHRDGWKGTAFLDLYSYKEGERARKLRGEINSRYHEGPAIVAPDGRIYLTRSSYSGTGPLDQTRTNKKGLDKLMLFSASAESGKWQIDASPVFSFNDKSYSVAHPSFDRNNLRLYFASDMPGGYGGVDLYVAELQAGEIWGKPVNLGPEINTAGDEMYPFIHVDGTLYFASDGHQGLGALDVFEAKPTGEGWGKAVNMGQPINSSRDDFGLIFSDTRSGGYVVSNRAGGRGADDIYKVNSTGILLSGEIYDDFSGEKVIGATVQLRESGKLRSSATSNEQGSYGFSVPANRNFEIVVSKAGFKQKVAPVEVGNISYPGNVLVNIGLEDTLLISLLGQVVNKETRQPVNEAAITVYNKCTNSNEQLSVDENGLFKIRLEPNCTYYLGASGDGFLDDNDVVSTSGLTKSIELASTLELVELKKDLVIELKNIYYDYGKFFIREDAVEDLDKLAQLMLQYPSLKIELSSHTDSRGSASFNAELSQKRAETCVDYLSKLGISRERLFAKGYGEQALKNHCVQGIECSEAEHQVNRRTEFRVLSFDRVLYSGDKARIAVNTGKAAFGAEETFEQKLNDQHLVVMTDQENEAAPDEEVQNTLLDKKSKSTEGMVVSIAERPMKSEEDVAPVEPSKGGEATASNPNWWESGMAYAVQLSKSGSIGDYQDYASLGTLYKAGDAVMLGFYKKYSAAATVVYQCSKIGIDKAFVVTYKNGVRVD